MTGLFALALGGEALVRGALAAGRRLRLSPLLAGLVIVGFGTSMPELVVSVQATLAARPDIAVGNVVGSNIANVLLILGVCAVMSPLSISGAALRRDGLTMLAASLLLLVLLLGQQLTRAHGAILLAALACYLAWAYWSEGVNGDPAAEVHRGEAEELHWLPRTTALIALFLVGGLGLLLAGARLLLTGAVALGQHLGIDEAVIGLSVVAVGTSLPEFAVSVVATLRRHADVAVGNVLGSNIFNLLGILGVSALLQPLAVSSRILALDQWVMFGAALLLVVFLLTGMRVSRLEGGLLLAGYAIYLLLMFG